MRPRTLFICGSLNQTTQLHAVARELRELDASFTPSTAIVSSTECARLGLIDMTIGGEKRRGWCLDYLKSHCLQSICMASGAVTTSSCTCTDLVVPKNVRRSKLVVVQEGIFDRDGMIALPSVGHSASCLGGSPALAQRGKCFVYDRFCAASDGFRERIVTVEVPTRARSS